MHRKNELRFPKYLRKYLREKRKKNINVIFNIIIVKLFYLFLSNDYQNL